jgi:hypothetical protein
LLEPTFWSERRLYFELDLPIVRGGGEEVRPFSDAGVGILTKTVGCVQRTTASPENSMFNARTIRRK